MAVVEGAEHLIQKLKAIKQSVAKRLLRKAIGNGTRAILRAAKSQAPTRTSLLRKSLGRKVKAYRGGIAVAGIVGARLGFRQVRGEGKRGKRAGKTLYADPVKYEHLVELGTVRSRAQAFLNPAWLAVKSSVTADLKETLAAGIAKAAGG